MLQKSRVALRFQLLSCLVSIVAFPLSSFAWQFQPAKEIQVTDFFGMNGTFVLDDVGQCTPGWVTVRGDGMVAFVGDRCQPKPQYRAPNGRTLSLYSIGLDVEFTAEEFRKMCPDPRSDHSCTVELKGANVRDFVGQHQVRMISLEIYPNSSSDRDVVEFISMFYKFDPSNPEVSIYVGYRDSQPGYTVKSYGKILSRY